MHVSKCWSDISESKQSSSDVHKFINGPSRLFSFRFSIVALNRFYL